MWRPMNECGSLRKLRGATVSPCQLIQLNQPEICPSTSEVLDCQSDDEPSPLLPLQTPQQDEGGGKINDDQVGGFVAAQRKVTVLLP